MVQSYEQGDGPTAGRRVDDPSWRGPRTRRETALLEQVCQLREAFAALQGRARREGHWAVGSEERLQCLNEELQAANEELQADNEELRVGNEELAESREELLAAHEALHRAHDDLSLQAAELRAARDDLAGVLSSGDVMTVFLDRQLLIRRYTPAAARRFGFIPGDLGRPVSDIAGVPGGGTLGEDAASVLERLDPAEREVGDREGRWYLRRLVPWRTEGGVRISGAVASFVDISQRRAAEAVLREFNRQLEQRVSERTAALEAQARQLAGQHGLLKALVGSTQAALFGWSPEGVVLDWSEGAERLLGYAAADVIGQDVARLAMSGERREFALEWTAGHATDREGVLRHRDGHAVHVWWTSAGVHDEAGQLVAVAAIAADATERARVERGLAVEADEQRRALGDALHDSFGQQLSAIGLLAAMLAPLQTERVGPMAGLHAKLEQAVDAAKQQLRALIGGLLPLQVEAGELPFALRELARTTEHLHGIACRCECPPELALPADDFAAQQLYLIAAEAVHNAVKHARATQLSIRLDRARGEPRGMRLVVEDDGLGLTARPRRADGEGGRGLRIMRHRSRLIGAALSITPGVGGRGTAVRCVIAGAST